MTPLVPRVARLFLSALITCAITSPAFAQGDGWRTIQFETNQVTAPDVAISPDGRLVAFQSHRAP